MNTFKKPNFIIESLCTLNIYGQRIINNILLKFNAEDPDIKTFRIDFRDFIGEHASGSQYLKANEVLENITSQYYKHYISFENYVTIFPIESCRILKGHPKIELKITSQFIEHLKSMKNGNFTVLNYDTIYNIKSLHGIRIYELLQQYYNTQDQTRFIELSKLKFYLNISDNQYQNFSDFKRYVLNIANKNFLKFSKFKFDVFEIKSGHRVTKLKFVLCENLEYQKTPQVPVSDNKDEDSILKFLKDMYGIDKTNEYLQKYKYEYLELCIGYAKKYAKRNIKKYLIAVIRDNPMNYGVIPEVPEVNPKKEYLPPVKSKPIDIPEPQITLDEMSEDEKVKLYEYCDNRFENFKKLSGEMKDIYAETSINEYLQKKYET